MTQPLRKQRGRWVRSRTHQELNNSEGHPRFGYHPDANGRLRGQTSPSEAFSRNAWARGWPRPTFSRSSPWRYRIHTQPLPSGTPRAGSSPLSPRHITLQLPDEITQNVTETARTHLNFFFFMISVRNYLIEYKSLVCPFFRRELVKANIKTNYNLPH